MKDFADLNPEVDSVSAGALAPTSKSTLLRLVFSFPVMLASTLVVLAVLTVRGRINDPDLWWHLKTGEIISSTHSIPQTDLFSFTTNNHVWTPHEWLAQVTIYAGWKLGGYQGLMLWLCLFTSLLLIASYSLCSSYSGNAKVALLGALVCWFFATVGLAVRPHIIGYLLLTCELFIVHLARSRNARWFLLLPPLFALWVNCHGSFFFGLAALAVFLVCSVFDFRIGSLVAPRWEKAQRNMLALALVLSILALFVNPVGWRQVIYPLDVMLNQGTGLSAVTEWQPLTFNDGRAMGLLGVVGFVFLLILVKRVELRLDEMLLLAMGFVMAVQHYRMLFLFGVLAAPVLSRLLSNEWETYESGRDRPGANAIMLLLAASTVVLSFPTAPELELQIKKTSPVKAVEFIRRTGLHGRMLNEYDYGGYLIWAAPEHKVFVDGRSDVYEWTGVLQEYGAWATLQSDPNTLLDKYKIDFCLMSRTAPMSRVLTYLGGWTKIYSDDLSVIFAKSAPPKNKG